MPPQTATAINHSFDPLVPKFRGANVLVEPVNLQPSTTFLAGQLLAFSGTSAADVQTVTVNGSPSSGTFTLAGYNPLTGRNIAPAAVAEGATIAAFQAELVKPANFGAGNVVVSGSTGGPFTLTFAGGLAALPVPLLTVASSALVGGSSPSVTIAHTTTGRTGGTYGKYDATVVAVPAAPSVSGTGSGSGWGAGTYLVQITAVNAQGETTPSIATKITLTAAQLIRVAAQASLGTSVTSINIYVNGVLIGSSAVTSGTSAQADMDNVSLAVTGQPPLVNTAYTIPNGAGTQKATGACIYTCQTDAAGQIAYSSTQTTDEWGQTSDVAGMFVTGTFDVSKLVGLDAKAVTDLGRLRWGTTTAGEIVFV